MNPQNINLENLFINPKGQVKKVKQCTIAMGVTYVVFEEEFHKPEVLWVRPVKITIPWLLKLGFEDMGKDSYGVRSFIKNGVEIAIANRSRTYLCENITINGVSGFDVKYVHDIQNLYKILTKKDLI